MTKFIDANIFIYASTKSKYRGKCRKLLEEDNDFITSTLVLNEVFSSLSKITKNMHFTRSIIRGIMNNNNIKIIDFSFNIFFT